MIYSQEGTRRAAAARSEDGIAIPKGTEVMVTRYEKGIAYVRPWAGARVAAGVKELYEINTIEFL